MSLISQTPDGGKRACPCRDLYDQMPDRVVSEISGVLLLFPSLSREGVFLLIRVIPLRSVHFSTQLQLALSLSLSWRLALGVVADTQMEICSPMNAHSVDCAVALCSLCFAVFDLNK